MAYTSDKLPSELDAVTTADTGDVFVVGDSSDSNRAKKITIDNLLTQLWAAVATLTNKTFNLTNNTLTGTTAEFNTALSDGNFATQAGSETLTNKTIALGSNTVSGTTAEFNTALSDNDFATLAGSETLTNKDISSATNTYRSASDSATGAVELATIAETNTGTDTARAVTPDGLSSAVKSIMLTAAGGAPLTTAGCSEPTKVESTTNDINYFVLDFDAITEEHAFWSFVMPENWDAGTITAQFYWTNASGLTTETVAWGIAGGSWADGDAIDAALGTEVTTSDIWLAQNDLHISPKSTAVTIANATAGEWVNIVVARKVASDNLTGDARLIAVKLTYTIDQYSDEI